eukprot:gene8893-9630_t
MVVNLGLVFALLFALIGRINARVYTLDDYRSLGFVELLVFDKVYVEIGSNIGPYVKRRLRKHLTSLSSNFQKVEVVDELKQVFNGKSDQSTSDNRILTVSLGNGTQSLEDIPSSVLTTLPWESYKIVFKQHESNIFSLSANGLPLDPSIRKNISFNALAVNYGAIAGSYAVLELLGFAFLHPLEPYYPPELRFSRNTDFNNRSEIVFLETPYWPQRAFHLHTQHPLELTEVLQGHDIPQFGKHGAECREFSEYSTAYRRDQNLSFSSRHTANTSSTTTTPYCERWEDMLIDVDSFYEWSIANGLNMIEWLLLDNFKWGDELTTRFYRFKRLTQLGHQYSLLIGADVPIGNIQQHGWYMVNVRLPIQEQKQQIKDRIDWIFHSGFDFLTTESGLSEFTHPECDLMIDLFNTFASYINETWSRQSAVKVHCSTGQYCSDYLDPRNGDPMNFNFLPTFTHPGLGILPHTVQMYSFDDPTAGSYGNNNFSYMEDYLVFEGKLKKRNILYYGETSYWVNVDIDVPLFLPIYGQRRIKDLRKIAYRENVENFHISGQMNFDSGWEYGYWLNDVVTARGSWNPHINSEKIELYRQCMNNIEDEGTTPFEQEEDRAGKRTKAQWKEKNCPPFSDEYDEYHSMLRIYSNIYGPKYALPLTDLITQLTKLQSNLLIHSYIRNRPNPNLKKLSGIAYLSGIDTWVELPRQLGLSFTQPDKVHLYESDDIDWPYVLELLQEMEEEFEKISEEFHLLLYTIQEDYNHQQQTTTLTRRSEEQFLLNQQAIDYLEEIIDSMQLLYLRTKQVHLLYQSNDADLSYESKRRKSLLQQSRDVIEEAKNIVQRREQYYRVPWQRIASWRENPTVYRFGYLWAVHSLYYWWRDQGIAETLTKTFKRHSPCYLNRMDSTEVAVGWGKYTLEWIRYFVTNYTPFASVFPLEIVNCLTPPSHEYQFPRDL